VRLKIKVVNKVKYLLTEAMYNRFLVLAGFIAIFFIKIIRMLFNFKNLRLTKAYEIF